MKDLDTDFKAREILFSSGRFGEHAGMIYPNQSIILTEEEKEAIDYLCAEWDYCYDPTPAL